MYAYLEEQLSIGDRKIFSIDVCEDYFALEEHQWGLAPMHYCREYYQEVLEQIHRKIQMDYRKNE